MNRFKSSINLFLFIILGFLAVSQVFILNSYSTSGDVQTELLTQIKQIEDENSLYTQKIASYSAIATLSFKAEQNGFKPVSTTISLNGPLPIAYTLQTAL